ncbi:MAG: amidohydrolase family protein, partial [Gemmatimonadota bacterium]|nr:amidohydrolase family protein [Gemmatimonadota bacterium]
LQAITSATANAAWAIGIADSVGTLAPGKAADLVLLGADPTANIAHTRDVRLVMQGGRMVRPR